jgi:multicomponent K+:H+ antiporter subunit A
LIIHALLAPVTAGQPLLPVGGGEADRHPLMLQLASRALLPFALLVSVYLYLRGHNQPGGGFIAGLVLAIALLLQHVAHGQRWMAARARKTTALDGLGPADRRGHGRPAGWVRPS